MSDSIGIAIALVIISETNIFNINPGMTAQAVTEMAKSKQHVLYCSDLGNRSILLNIIFGLSILAKYGRTSLFNFNISWTKHPERVNKIYVKNIFAGIQIRMPEAIKLMSNGIEMHIIKHKKMRLIKNLL